MSYPHPQQPAAPMLPTPDTNQMALYGLILGVAGWVILMGLGIVTALSLGICGVCTGPLSCLTPLLWLAGLVLSGMGLSQVNSDPTAYASSSKSLAIIGLAANGAGLLLTLCGIIVSLFSLVAGVTLPLLSVPFLEGMEGFQTH